MSEEAQAAASDASKQPAAEGGAPAPHAPDALDTNSLSQHNLSQMTASSVPPADNAKWICEVCTYENYPLSRKVHTIHQCTMCRSSKPVLGEDIFKLQDGASALPAPQEPSGAEAVAERLKPLRISSPQAQGHSSSCSVAKWACNTCTYENWPRSLRCAMCGAGAPPASPPARPRPALGINDICNSVSEAEGARRSKRSQTHSNIDWVWLQACLGVVEGSARLVEAYLAAGGDPARALTPPEVQLLNRASAFDAGHTLVHLAIRFQRQEILSTLLSRISGGGPGIKRSPSYIAPDLATAIRRHMAGCIRFKKGNFPCRYINEFCTFSLPCEIEELPPAVREQLLNEVLDREVQSTLEQAALINWGGGGGRLWALWNRSAGDCLPDALCQAAYGVADRADTLRGALGEWLRGAPPALHSRWRAAERAAAARAGYAPTDAQLRADWARLVHAADTPRTPLHQLHVFVLAHVLRRPLIVYGVDVVNSFRGEALGYARFQGVYLPLLWDPSSCCKSPLAIGYTRGHFSALVPLESYPHRHFICSERQEEEVEDVTYLPLTDSDGKLLPVHFLTADEAEEAEAVLRRWLRTDERRGAELCARQARPPRPLLQAQMLEEWLNHYRRLAQQTRGPFPPRLNTEYSSDPETEDE